MTRIEDLNKRAKFQKPNRQSDGRGGWKTTGFADVVTVWANLKAKTSYRDRENENEQQVQSSMTYILTVRFRTDIFANMRAIVDGKKLYIVKNPYDPDGHRRWLCMECEEREP